MMIIIYHSEICHAGILFIMAGKYNYVSVAEKEWKGCLKSVSQEMSY